MGASGVKWCERVLVLCGLCLLAIAFLIGLGVMMHLLGISRLVGFENSYLLFDRGVTFNSLMGLQVLLFSTAIMLAIAPVLLLNRHVRVDIFHAKLSRRGQRFIDIIGHLFFALPFFGLLLMPAYRFAERAFLTGESSTDGGLSDIYIIKAMLPVGILLFLAALLYAVLKLLQGRTSQEMADG